MDKFLEKHKLAKPTQEEIENMNRYKSKKIEFFSTKISEAQMASSHSKNTSSTQNFPKKWKKSKHIPTHAMSYHKTPEENVTIILQPSVPILQT